MKIFEAIKSSTDCKITPDSYVKNVDINYNWLKCSLYNKFHVNIDENKLRGYDSMKLSEYAQVLAKLMSSTNSSDETNLTNRYPSVEENINILSSKANLIPVGTQLANELRTLSTDIENGQNELQKSLNMLNVSSLNIDIRRNWWGTMNKDSIIKSFQTVYSDLSFYIKKCGTAINQTNENLGRTLELIKLLAIVEKDLYDKIDNQEISNNELKAILLDWFKKQGIKDEDVQELIETSFKRAYTLRDRLNDFRKEYRENIALCSKKIEKFENRYTSLDNEIDVLVKNTKLELQNALENDKRIFEHLAKTNEKKLKELSESSCKRIEKENNRISEILYSIERSFSKIIEKENKFNSLAETKLKELSQVKNDVEKDIKEFVTEKENGIVGKFISSYNEFSDNLIRTSVEVQKKIEEKKQTIENSINESKSSFDDSIREYNKTFESLKNELQNQINEQNDKFEKEKNTLRSSFKNKIFWTLIGSTIISSVIAYFVATLTI